MKLIDEMAEAILPTHDGDLVSVIITTYSRSNTLQRAIASVVKQTYSNLEIIVVDDNDDEQIRRDVKNVVSLFNDSRISLIQNIANIGGAASRNVGIAAATAEYIAFLDDDDEYLPKKIELQHRRLLRSNQNVALVYCHCQMIDSNGSPVRTYSYRFRGNCLFEGMCDCIAATSQWMCRKSALEQVGGFSIVPCKQDSYLIVKLLAAGFEVDYVPEVLSLYHRDAGFGISTSGHEKRVSGEEALRSLCRANYALLKPEEIREVEYHFSSRLFEHYWAIGDRRKAKLACAEMLKHPFRRDTLAALKHVVFAKRAR